MIKKETGMVKARSVYHIGGYYDHLFRYHGICSRSGKGQVVEQTDATENETGV